MLLPTSFHSFIFQYAISMCDWCCYSFVILMMVKSMALIFYAWKIGIKPHTQSKTSSNMKLDECQTSYNKALPTSAALSWITLVKHSRTPQPEKRRRASSNMEFAYYHQPKRGTKRGVNGTDRLRWVLPFKLCRIFDHICIDLVRW